MEVDKNHKLLNATLKLFAVFALLTMLRSFLMFLGSKSKTVSTLEQTGPALQTQFSSFLHHSSESRAQCYLSSSLKWTCSVDAPCKTCYILNSIAKKVLANEYLFWISVIHLHINWPFIHLRLQLFPLSCCNKPLPPCCSTQVKTKCLEYTYIYIFFISLRWTLARLLCAIAVMGVVFTCVMLQQQMCDPAVWAV